MHATAALVQDVVLEVTSQDLSPSSLSIPFNELGEARVEGLQISGRFPAADPRPASAVVLFSFATLTRSRVTTRRTIRDYDGDRLPFSIIPSIVPTVLRCARHGHCSRPLANSIVGVA